MDKKHLFSLSLTLIIVMLFSAMGPTTVYADDGAPTDAPSAEVSETDGEAEEAAIEEEVADEAGEGETDDAVTEEDAAEEPVDEAGRRNSRFRRRDR